MPEVEVEIIEGLTLHVPGNEVKDLLSKKAAYHRRRAADYKKTFDTLSEALGGITPENAPKMSSSTRDPIQEQRDGMERHTNNAIEDEFLAAHVVTDASYRLDTTDLQRIGVLKSRY